MADIGLKIQILHKSISTFKSWLDSCDQLLADLPTELQTCQSSMLRELALKYKDLLLQMKERCSYIQEVNNLCMEIGEETSDSKDRSSPEVQSSHNSELADLATEVRDLNTRFTTTCIQAKQHYADLSSAIAVAGGDRPVSSLSKASKSSKSSAKFHRSKSERRKHRKRTQSLYIEEEEQKSEPTTTADKIEIVNQNRSPKVLKRSRSWSLPTDLDDMIKKQSNSEDPAGSHGNSLGGGSNNGQQNPTVAHGKQETPHSSEKTNSSSSPGAIKSQRPALDHSESLDSSRPATSSFVRDLDSLRGSKRSRRPKSAVFVSGDEAQFCYLDDQGSPIDPSLSNSPVLKVSPGSNKAATKTATPLGKPVMLKFEAAPRTRSQRSSVTSIGSLPLAEDFKLHPLVDSRRGLTTNQNTSLLSDSSSLLGSNFTESVLCGGGGDRVDSGVRLSKSMDELLTIATDDERHKQRDLSSRLSDLSVQLQDFVHSIAESRKCSLQSLALELHLGEVKAMLTILEVQETELIRLRATFSPLAKRRLEEMESLKTISNSSTYPKEQVADKREEILKLSERVGILRRHCADAVQQYEEVLELVVQYENQFKVLKDFLASHASNVEAIKKRMKDQPDETWRGLSEELTTVSEEKPQLKCIHELSVHLLYLEPIFDGNQVREDLKGLTVKFQQLTLKIFSLLEEQAKQRAEGLLMESSVMSSWITEAGLSVQALAKKARKTLTPKTKLAATKETITQELYKHQSSLEVISDKLHPILAVLNSDETPNLDELVLQVETNRKSLKQIENNLLDINIGLSQDNLAISHSETSLLSRSKTISEGVKKLPNIHARSFSEVGVNEQLKQFQESKEVEPPVKVKGQREGHYAEIGSLREEILNRQFSVGSSNVPQPSLRGGVPNSAEVEGQRSSLYERVELPSPLVDFDHAPSRQLDKAIEMLPQMSPAHSLSHTPTHSTSAYSTPSHRPNGKVQVQYVEIDLSQEQHVTRNSGQPKSSSVSSLDRLQGQGSPDPTYAEIGKKDKKFADYAEISKFRRSENNFSSSPNLKSKTTPKYAEIEVRKLSELASDDKYAEIEVRPEPVEAFSEERVKKKIGGRLRKRKLSLHEELLEFIGEEWADLSLKKTTHQAALDEAALDQSLGNIASLELRNMCQRFVRGVREVEAGVQGVMEQISVLKPPNSPDLERVHSAIDQCQKLLDRLNKLHPKLDSYNSDSLNLISSLGRSPSCARVAQLIEIRLFELSTLWYSANLKASTYMQELRSQEGDINYLYRQLQQLSRVLKEGSTLLAQKDTVTNVDDYLTSCKAMYGKLGDLSDLRKQVSSDIKETVSQTTQTAITKELVDQMREVSTQWKSVTKQLQKMPTVEHLLIQLSLANISAELETMATMFSALEVRALRADEAATNCASCKTQLEKARLLSSSLASIKAKLLVPSGNLSIEISSPGQQHRNGQSAESTDTDQAALSEQSADSAEVVKDKSSPMLSQCEQLVERVGRILTKTEKLSAQLQDESDLIVQFHSELNDLQLWMSDTQSMLLLSVAEGPTSVSQLRGKHQAIFQQIVTRQPKLISVQSLAEKLVTLPSNQSEKQLIESLLSDVCTMWDSLCKQIVPAGSLPQVMTPMAASGRKLQFEPTAEFDDIHQMVDWLTMLDFKLQPKPIVVGDVKQIRRCLQDLQMIASEARSREQDYNRFIDGESLPTSIRTDSLPPYFDSELSSMARSMLGDTTPDGIYQVPSKFVKFYDESTLERHQRRQQITVQNTDDVNTVVETDGDSTPLEDSLTEYNSEGPAAGQWNEIETKSRSGMELRLGSLDSRRQPHRQLSDVSRDEEISLTSLSSQLNEDSYQLFLLWKSIWVSLGQQKKRLESTLEVWKNFEVRKEEFCNFLSTAEEGVGGFFKSLSECKDLTVVQTVITKQQALYNETATFSQRLATLNHLSDDLITNRHSYDDTSDLKDMMADLNKRWGTVTESVSQHQSTVTAVATRWAEFYREYQSFQKWINNLDMDMSNINPFIGNLSSVRIQLEKMKEIQQELHSREGGVESVRLLAYQLLQGVGGCHINTAAVHNRLDNLGRRVKQLETLSQERRTDLELALTEKQDFISHLADTLTWLSQAEKHLSSQKPLGTDFDTVNSQYQAHQGFWKEVLEQQPKIRSVIASGNRLANESHWTQGTGEHLRAQFGGVAPRWEGLWSEGEDWGRLLGGVYPEMEIFQSLCSECGQKLSSCELIVGKLEPVSRKLHLLDKQMDDLDIFEASLVAIGKQLEAIVLSQRKQVQLGVKVNSDLFKLVKGFHHHWNQLKQCVDQRRVAIQSAQIQYDPANLSTTELPLGWKRASTENGTPYFINTAKRGHTQWEHPDLATLYSSLQTQHSLSSYPSTSYPIALKLRALQQKTRLARLRTKSCVNVYTAHTSDPTHKSSPTNHDLSFYDMTVLAIDLFQTVEEDIEKGVGPIDRGNQFYINKAVEMSTCWIRDIYDLDHQGKVGCVPMILAAVCLSKGKLEDKYKALFKVATRGESSIDLEGVTTFLEHAMMMGQSVSDSPFCSLHAVDVCARECFRKYVGVGRLHLQQFISWLHSEPPPLSWLPILHRLGASEHAQHDVKCSVCKSQSITGFRYRCVQCANFDMCQNCYWSGLSGKGHDRTKHFMEEYCMPKPADEVNFLKTIRKSFRLKKKTQLDPPQSGKVGVADNAHTGTPMERRWTTSGKGSPSTGKRQTYVSVSLGAHTLGRELKASLHPGRRFTVLEDVQSSWRMSDSTAAARRNKMSSFYPPPSTSPSNTGWRRGHNKPPPTPTRTNNLEESLSKISQTSKSLSFRLRSLREKQTSPGAREGSPEPEDTPDRDGGRSPTPEEELRRRNAMLQGRVQLLQEHNLRLENCISQLKLIDSLQQSTRHGSLRPLPSQPRPHPSTVRPPPLPSRTIQPDIYDVPTSHRNADTYDVPPATGAMYDLPPNTPADYEIPPNGDELYSVPTGTRRTSSPAELYMVPTSNPKLSASELYSVPMATQKNTSSPDLYSVPPSRGKPNTSELYSVPPSSRKTSSPSDIYDVPPPQKMTRDLPAIPPPMAVLSSSQRNWIQSNSQQGVLNSSNSTKFQGGMETYDIPPPRLLSAPPNPKIPPPKLPRRTNTAPASGTSKRSSSII